MQNKEIKDRIASIPHWHYQFDLKGNLTPIFKKTHVRRHAQRKKHFFNEQGLGLLGKFALFKPIREPTSGLELLA